MADILQYYDLNRASTSRKMSRKIRADGFEAPRNSLEFPIAASHARHAFYESKANPSKMDYSYRGTTMKKLIDDEISNQPNERRNSPSVVARLMGMDAIPAEKDAVVHAKEIKVQKAGTSVVRMDTMDSAAGQCNSPKLAPFKQSKCNLLSYGSKREASLSWKPQRSTRPQPREHPQEELLQKFKKDFEAWQTSKVLEKSTALVVENNLSKGKYIQILAQENLNKEKMARYVDTKKILAQKKISESSEVALISQIKPDTQQGGDSKCQSHMSLQHEMDVTGAGSVNNCKQLQVAKVADRYERSHSPTRIIILKPSCERRIDTEESWVGSSEVKKDCSMEDFLEEVKERLKCEIKGKARSNSSTKGSQTESPFRDRPTDPKQIARNIAKHIRESATRDIGWKMMRSESNRSSMRGFQINGTEPEQIIKRDTRRILPDRVKDVCKNEVDLKKSIINDEMSGDSYIKSKGRVKSMTDIPNIAWEDKKTMSESMLRHKKDNILLFNSQVVLPRNLARSFSAPVPGTAFGKLLLEEQHILTGAHIHRKRETSETTSKEVKKNRRDSLNLKGRVSYLKQNFTLKGKLFGKRTHSSKKSTAGETNSMKIIRTIPLAILNCGITQPQDNYTEVPPSPASVSSSSHNEYCTPDNPSPVSPLDVQPLRQSCGDLICNFPELSQSEDVENEKSEEVTIEEKYYKDEITEIENPDEAYIKDILVTAGLYEDRSFDQANPRWDALRIPISYKIVEEVEEAYSRYKKVDNEDSFLDHCDTSLSHRLLFDLVNEALQSIGSIPRNNATVTRWILDSAEVPRGKKLLDELWHHIQCYTNLPMDEMHTIDGMVARDVRMTPWPATLYEDIDVSCRKIECAILGELIDDFVRDICFRWCKE
ncbi:uncharacterized protein [Typha latifolia]|uniref:uncharacterized protein isoform X3 n=1 Tax=Typha latifolia TaxID=4733 RepID=UPI003C2E6031